MNPIVRRLLGVAIALLAVFLLLLSFILPVQWPMQSTQAYGWIVELILIFASDVLFFVCYICSMLLFFDILPRAITKDFMQDGKSPIVLYLRSFREDENNDVERIVTATFSKTAEVVAIGRPGGTLLRPIGAARVYSDQWQETVTALAQRAQVIIMNVDLTDGILWELEMLNKTKTIDKLVIIKEYGRLTPSAKTTITSVVISKIPDWLPPICLITFENGEPLIVDSPYYKKEPQYLVRHLLERHFNKRPFRKRSLRDSPFIP